MGQRSEKRKRKTERFKKFQRSVFKSVTLYGDAFIPSNKEIKKMEKEGKI